MCVKSHSSLRGSCWLLMSVHLGKERVFWSPVTVLPQEAEIDSIHQLVVGATENIKEGNEDIREVSTLGAPQVSPLWHHVWAAAVILLAWLPKCLAGAQPPGLTWWHHTASSPSPPNPGPPLLPRDMTHGPPKEQ